MKKIVLMLTAMLLLSGYGYSQKIAADKVPADVKTAFQKKFPTAAKVTYEMEKVDYEINFTLSGTECSAVFDKDGKWIETETDVKDSELPAKVKATLDKEFAGYKHNESVKLEIPWRAFIYEFEVSKGDTKLEVQIDQDGTVLSKDPIGKEDKD